MPFLNGINWAVLMFHNGTNWLSYLNVRLFAPGWDLSHSTMTDKINSTSLKREGPAQRAQHSSWGWLKHVCRDTSLYPTHAVLCHLWPNDVRLQKLRFDMTKPEGPLASPMILLETLELGEATVCLLCPSKWRQMGSHKFLPIPDPPNPAWGCRQPHRADTDVTCLPCFCWQQLQTPHSCGSATKMRWGWFPPPFPALGSTSDVQHMPEDSLFSSGTQWSLLRSKMNSPRSCPWSLQ